MTVLTIGVTILILLVILFTSNKKRRSEKNIELFRNNWGKTKTESFYFEGIKSFSEIVKDNNFHRLSEQTINDIDFYNLFTFIDRTTSKIGQQLLFKRLIEPTDNLSDPSQKLVELFASDSQLREEVQTELLKLNNTDVYYISTLMQNNLLEKPNWLKYLKIDLILLLFLSIISFKFPALFIVVLLIFSFNLLLHYWNKTNAFKFIKSFPQLNILVNVSKILVKKEKLTVDNLSASHF
ncbi:hypothetical protein [Flectobacillus rivi]|uniref:DNA mismatch repair protein MutS core domain-containing protein n=1 Tax=Flectobacillus rivi TaxID=2984209 RepID=A0ABT6Z5E7_9BACT|nr:hypothetical protein [Flectobacillus rivi]MDI9876220.1 hypothetical protein [Flectobacillus rivi]